MLLTSLGIKLILSWSANCIITNSPGAGTFAIKDNRKHNVPVRTLSVQDYAKLLQQKKSGWKRTT